MHPIWSAFPLRLHTFGGLAIASDAGERLTGAPARRRALALLAVLAAAPEGASREALCLLFWPESDTERARNALSQTLFALRRDLARPDVVTGTATLRLNPAVCTSDVGDFAAALAAGQPERAMTLYVGAFLDGVHLRGAPEFERWCDTERERLARVTADTVRRLAREATRRGDPEIAVGWWRRLATLEPTSAPVAVATMDALAAAGDVAGALQHATTYAARVRAEWDAAPDPAVVALTARLRRALPPPPPPAAPEPEPELTGTPEREPLTIEPLVIVPARSRGAEPLHCADEARPGVAAVPASPSPSRPEGVASVAPRDPGVDAPVHPPIDVPPDLDAGRGTEDPLLPAGLPSGEGGRPRTRESARRQLAPATLVLLAVIGAGVWTARRGARAAAPSADRVVAVFPFHVAAPASEASSGAWREGVAEVLSTDLDGVSDVRSVTPAAVLDALGPDTTGALGPARASDVAERLGATRFVLGEVTDLGGDHLRIGAVLYAHTGHVLARADADGPPAALATLVDQVAGRLLPDLTDVGREPLTQTAVRTTASLPALKAYVAGERAYRARRYAEAADLFQRAVTADTGFALAYYRLSLADEWASGRDQGRTAAEHAVAHLDRLPLRERELLEGRRALLRGALAVAEQHFQWATTRYPDDAEAWYQLGELAFHYDPLRGYPLAAARQPFERALQYQPDNAEVWSHLRLLDAFQGRTADVAALTRRLTTRAGATADVALLAFDAFATGDVASGVPAAPDHAAETRALADLAHASGEAVFTLARNVIVYARNLAGAERIVRLLTDPAREPRYRVRGYVLQAELALAQGRWRDAVAALGPHPGLDPAWGVELRGVFAALPTLALPHADVLALRDTLLRVNHPPPRPYDDPLFGVDPRDAPYARALLDARLGDTTALRRESAMLESATRERAVRATTHAATHADAEAATGRAEAAPPPADPDTAALARAFAATMRAALAQARGDHAAALAALDAGRLELPLGSMLNLLGAQTVERFQRAEVLHALGRDDEALRWWGTIGQASPFEVPWIAPAELRQAEVEDQRGNVPAAVHHYRRFVALWAACDPELRPVVARAAARLRQLGAAPTP